MTSRRSTLRGALCIAPLGLLLGAPTSAPAQLRPLDPFPWEVLDGTAWITGGIGADVLWGQRASLAGTEGRLVDAGAFHVAFRTGRVVLEAGGTLRRTLAEESSFSPPLTMVEASTSGRRSDTGDFRVATALLLTPPGAPAAAIIRFGTRLPTTDDQVGLERDRTDFFANVAGRLGNETFRATTELGVGIHGTHDAHIEQSDVLNFSATFGAPGWPLQPTFILSGHADGLPDRTIRGNEELAEILLRLRTRTTPWVQLRGGRGLTEFSPELILSLAVGATF